MGAIDKVLAELESLGDKAIQKRILGLGADEEEPKAMAAAETPEDEKAEGEEELSPDMLEKLKALLSK